MAYEQVFNDLNKLVQSFSSIDFQSPEAKTKMVDAASAVLFQANENLEQILSDFNISSSAAQRVLKINEKLINLITGAAKLGIANNMSGGNKQEVISLSLGLSGDLSSDLAEILQAVTTQNNPINAISAALSKNIKDIHAASNSIIYAHDAKSLYNAVVSTIAATNEFVQESIQALNPNAKLNALIKNLSQKFINIGSEVSGFIGNLNTTKEEKAQIAASSLKIMDLTNELIFSVLEYKNFGDAISNDLTKQTISNTLAQYQKSVSKLISGENTDLVNGISEVLKISNNSIKQLLDTHGVSSTISTKAQDVVDLAIEIAQTAALTNAQNAASNALEIAAKATLAANELANIAGAGNELSKQIAEQISADLKSLKGLAAQLSDTKDNKQISALSLELASEVGKSASKIAAIAGANEHAVKSADAIMSAAFKTAGKISDLAFATSPSEYAASSFDLASSANEVIKEILHAASIADSKQLDAISAAVAASLINFKQSAIKLTQIDLSQKDASAQIAIESFKLIDGANVLICDALAASNKAPSELAPISNIISNALDASKLVAKLSTIDASAPEAKADIAQSCVEFIKLASNISSEASELAKNPQAKAISQYLSTNLSGLNAAAKQIAQINPDSIQAKGQLASAAMGLLQELNTLANGSIKAAGINTSEHFKTITNSVLEIGKNISQIASADAKSDAGKATISANSIAMALEANSLIKQALDAAHVDNKIINSVLDASASMKEIGTKLSDLIIKADTSTQSGRVQIAKDSFELANGVNHLVGDVLTAAQLSNATSAAGSNIASSVLNLGKNIASLIDADINTTQGKAQIASGSLKIIGDTSGIVKEILSLSKSSSVIGNVITQTADGTLSSIGELIATGLKMHDFATLSQGDQIALGFDLGLKSLSTIATGISVGANAFNAITGASNYVPVVGQAVSAAALAISPLEIKALVDQKERVNELNESDKQFSQLGYLGDGMLASLRNDEFILDTSYFAINSAMSIASAAVATAASASVIGAPAALIAGLVKGVVSGILQAVKQPALEHIANKYKQQILSSEEASAYFEHNTKANLNNMYESDSFKSYLFALQNAYKAEQIVNLDGVALSPSAIELAAITSLNDQARKANNYATLIKDAQVIENSTKAQLDQASGVLELKELSNTLINFNTPLFAPGAEETTRTQVGKNSFYNKLVINGPDNYTINDHGFANTYLSSDKYATALFDADSNLLKKITLHINATDGDDTFIADSGFSTFNGASGTDSAVYSSDQIHGIKAVFDEQLGGYVVDKFIENANVVTERIEEKEVQYGKRTEKVQYRKLSLDKQSFTSTDTLLNTEVISASNHNDELIGGEGNDCFFGQDGDDVLIGNGGNDILDGGAGNDIIYGGAGDDLIIQSDAYGRDFIDGGSGIDTLDLSHMPSSVRINLATNQLVKNPHTANEIIDEVRNIENIIATSGDDEIIGNDEANMISTGAGNDIVMAGAGDDVIIAGIGINHLYGQAGDDMYQVRFDAQNFIKDTEGHNTLNINSLGEQIQLAASYQSIGNTLDLTTFGAGKMGLTSIKEFDKFGFIRLDGAYYLGLNPASKHLENGELDFNFKAIIGQAADAEASFDFAANALNFFHEGSALEIYATAQRNTLTLDHSHTNIINIQNGTHTQIYGFDAAKDSLVYESLSGVQTMVFDGDLLVNIDANTSVKLVGISEDVLHA